MDFFKNIMNAGKGPQLFTPAVNKIKKKKIRQSLKSMPGGMSIDKQSSDAMKKQIEAEAVAKQIQEQKELDIAEERELTEEVLDDNMGITDEEFEASGPKKEKEEGSKFDWKKGGKHLAATIVAAEEGRAKEAQLRKLENAKNISKTLSIFENAAKQKGAALTGLQAAMAGYFR